MQTEQTSSETNEDGDLAALAAEVEALRSGAGVYAPDDAVLEVRGEDRHAWLSGMLTQDLKGLAPGAGVYSAIVHVKGKLLADGFCHARDEALWLVVPASRAAALLAHFEQYIVMEDVEVAQREDLAVRTVQGPRALALWRAASEQGAAGGEGFVASAAERLGLGGGVDVFGPRGAGPAWLDAAIARGDARAVGEAAWETARLEAGVPRFGVDFGTDNYVQEAALTDRAVSFKKGCYVGQEVVCRLEMRGHVRRQLVALRFAEAVRPLPRPGAAVGAAVGVVGELTSVAFSPALGVPVALAMLKWDVAAAGGRVSVGEHEAAIVARPREG